MNPLIFPVITLVAALGLALLYTSPQYETVQELEQKDAQFTQSLQDLREIQSTIGRLESTYAGISTEDLQKLERFLPRTFDQTQAMNDLNALLTRLDIQVDEVKFEADDREIASVEEPTVLRKHEVTISFFGEYTGFKQVIENVERSLQIAAVKGVENLETRSALEEQGADGGAQLYGIELIYYSYNNELEE